MISKPKYIQLGTNPVITSHLLKQSQVRRIKKKKKEINKPLVKTVP